MAHFLEDIPEANDSCQFPRPMQGAPNRKSNSKRSGGKRSTDGASAAGGGGVGDDPPPDGGSTDIVPHKRQKYSTEDYKVANTFHRKCGVCGCFDDQCDDLVHAGQNMRWGYYRPKFNMAVMRLDTEGTTCYWDLRVYNGAFAVRFTLSEFKVECGKGGGVQEEASRFRAWMVQNIIDRFLFVQSIYLFIYLSI